VTARPTTRFFAAVALATSLFIAAPASAQVRGFADIGATTFTAKQSFETVLGSATGMAFGGGVEFVLPLHLFVDVHASRFRKDGERVFLFNGETFNLGIPTTVTVTPLEFTGGMRFGDARVVPYAGGGIGRHQYEETSEFATAAENVKQSFTGYQLLGGAEVRISQWLAAGGEVQWTTVPKALGTDPNGVSTQFHETNLGGVTFRIKVIVGR